MKKVDTVLYAASPKAGGPRAPAAGPQPPHDRRTTPTPAQQPKPGGIAATTRVVKTLRPGQAGTQRWQERYGDRLLCVRHREDLHATHRIVTLELIVESHPIRARALATTTTTTTNSKKTPADKGQDIDPRRHPVRVRIDIQEDTLRRKAYAAGATCDPHQPVWTMPLATARALRVLRRIIHE